PSLMISRMTCSLDVAVALIASSIHIEPLVCCPHEDAEVPVMPGHDRTAAVVDISPAARQSPRETRRSPERRSPVRQRAVGAQLAGRCATGPSGSATPAAARWPPG